MVKVSIPGDKSIAHRALILGALADGTSEISNLPNGLDVHSTIACLRALGVEIAVNESFATVRGKGLSGLKGAGHALDCGNSATTMRLLAGVLAGQPFYSVLTGDGSLRRRPMERVAGPLAQMGAGISLKDGVYAPIEFHGEVHGEVRGAKLNGIAYSLDVASAQVKSALLFASLFAEGETTVTGKIQSRDHTERLFKCFGLKIDAGEERITAPGAQTPKPARVFVPGDISSAAFWIGAACVGRGAACGPSCPSCYGGGVEIDNVGLNPTRLGFVNVLKRMGADIECLEYDDAYEPRGKIVARFSELRGVAVEAGEVPSLIDEIPLLAVIATQARGRTVIRGASELRFKETDRIEAVARNLSKMGGKVEVLDDGLAIHGPTTLQACEVESMGDHRIAMSFAVASLAANGGTKIIGAECADVSYPGFFGELFSGPFRGFHPGSEGGACA